MKIAVLSDIHANSWALRAVLNDIENKRPDIILDLGDSLYGPLNPRETFDLIKAYNIISILGNQDRFIIENISKNHDLATLHFVTEELNENALDWISSLPKTRITDSGIFLCHGTPDSDSTYLLEQLHDNYAGVNDTKKIAELLRGVNQKIILCGHSHTHRIVQIEDRFIINPGSVGLQAYDDELPVYHKIENFNNYTKYCILDLANNKLKIDQIALPYDVDKAVECAVRNNRTDWAKWLKFGRV